MTTALAYSVPAALAAGFKRSPARDMAVWGAHMWAYENAFELPNDDEARLRRRAHFDYALAIDSALSGGMPPSQRLQRRLRDPRRLSPLDKLVTLFYLTWEAEPHVVMAWIRRYHPEHFASAAARLAATFDLTLVGYWAAPSAPPWWVSEKAGRMDREVHRVVAQVMRALKGDSHPLEGDNEMGANPFAAMPSDHLASAAMTAILVAEHNPRLGALAWSYTGALGLALVYLGEHYVIDLAAGLALAVAVQAAHRPIVRALLRRPRARRRRPWPARR